MARRPQRVDEDESGFPARKAWRFGTWAAVAMVALAGAGAAALTSSGSHGSTTASAEAADPGRDAEARRLAETVRLLAADRDRLAARLAALEHNIGDITGSIGPGPHRAIVGAAPGTVAPAVPVPAPTAPIAAAPPTNPPATAPGKPPALQPLPGPAVGSADIATPADSGATGSIATRTEFGVDLGGGPSIEALRALWTQVKVGHEQLFDGLRPVMSIREAGKQGGIELRLIAGPLTNVTAAARMCATLTASGLTCQPAVFDGQRLALK